MKKIINGKLYDTTTAKDVCYFQRGESRSDIYYEALTLYRKKTGELFYFLEEYGYNRILLEKDLEKAKIYDRDGNLYSNTKKFVEDNGTIDDYENLYGKVEE